jgi:hypothetical protein
MDIPGHTGSFEVVAALLWEVMFFTSAIAVSGLNANIMIGMRQTQIDQKTC